MFYVISSLSRNLWYCLLSKEIVVIIIQAKFEILPYTPQKSYFVGTPCTLRFAQNDMNNVIRCIYFVIPSLSRDLQLSLLKKTKMTIPLLFRIMCCHFELVEKSPIKLFEKDKNYNLIFISKVKRLFFKYRCDILILFNAKSDNYWHLYDFLL